MHLTNTSRNFSGDLLSLNIKDKPEIDEYELNPPEAPPPDNSEPPPAPTNTEETQESLTAENESQTGSSNAESSTSSTDSKGTATIEDAIRQCAIKINTSLWTTQKINTLSTTYDILSTMVRCQSAVQQHSDEIKANSTAAEETKNEGDTDQQT